MLKEIKKRIEQIKAGQVPEGYKRTEVGIVPEEWVEKQIGELFTFEGGLSASRNELSDAGICYLHYGDIHKTSKNYIDVKAEFETIPKLDISFDNISNKSILNDGDIVFVDASEDYEGMGKYVVIKNIDNIPFISGLHTIVSKSKDRSMENEYKRFCFQNDMVKKQFLLYATGVSVYGLSKTNIAKVIIPLPPLPEQEKVAEFLNVWDKSIDLKEKLLTEKKRQKKWLMQKLLNPDSGVRLPGFNGKWRNARLGNLGEFRKGKGITSADVINEGLPGIMYGDIYVKYDIFFNRADFKISPDKARESTRVQKGDLLFTTSGETAEEIGKCVSYQGEEDIYIGGDIIALTPNKDYSLFLAYQQNSYKLIKQKAAFGQGHSVVHIYMDQLKDLKVSLPSLPEQIAIGEILFTADREIDLLEKELEQAKQQKKALMQLLLTGMVRVGEKRHLSLALPDAGRVRERLQR